LKTLKLVWILFTAAAVLAGCHEGSSNGTAGAASPSSTGAQTASAATLSWEAPTTDTNGAPLNNLAGYRIYYGASTMLCTPASLAQEGKLGMGAQAGETRMRAIFDEAGYSTFRRATETPFNIVYEARP